MDGSEIMVMFGSREVDEFLKALRKLFKTPSLRDGVSRFV